MCVENEKKVQPNMFNRIYKFYVDRGDFENALEALRKGVNHLPKDLGIRMKIAHLYEKLGINYRAIEEYRKALILNSNNKRAKKKLAKLLDEK